MSLVSRDGAKEGRSTTGGIVFAGGGAVMTGGGGVIGPAGGFVVFATRIGEFSTAGGSCTGGIDAVDGVGFQTTGVNTGTVCFTSSIGGGATSTTGAIFSATFCASPGFSVVARTGSLVDGVSC